MSRVAVVVGGELVEFIDDQTGPWKAYDGPVSYEDPARWEAVPQLPPGEAAVKAPHAE